MRHPRNHHLTARRRRIILGVAIILALASCAAVGIFDHRDTLPGIDTPMPW
jgi:hypothetical protein